MISLQSRLVFGMSVLFSAALPLSFGLGFAALGEPFQSPLVLQHLAPGLLASAAGILICTGIRVGFPLALLAWAVLVTGACFRVSIALAVGASAPVVDYITNGLHVVIGIAIVALSWKYWQRSKRLAIPS